MIEQYFNPAQQEVNLISARDNVVVGGRPNMAQAGGKNPAGIQEALKKAAEALEGQLS